MEVELTWMELSVEMEGGRTVVVQGERHQRSIVYLLKLSFLIS